MLLSDVCLPDVCLSRTSGVTREQRGLGRLKLSRDVLNSQHAGTGATWRINTKILSTCRGQRHIVGGCLPTAC